MSVQDSRIRIAFGVANATVALVLLVGVFGVVRPRFWGLDVPAAVISLVELVSAGAVLTQRPWALRALRLAAWVSFSLGLALVAVVVLSMAFLRSIHGDYGAAALAVSGLVVALLVPYVVVLPALQLLWLKPRA